MVYKIDLLVRHGLCIQHHPASKMSTTTVTKKRNRRPNQTFPLDTPPEDVSAYKRCDTHQLYSLHNCPRCVVEKREGTMLKRFGVKSALHSDEIVERRNATCLERYDTLHPSQLETIKEKMAKTNKQRYGVEHTLQCKDIRDKGKATMKERYGVEYSTQNKEVLKKRVETCLRLFGVENPLQNEEVKEKSRKSNLERYQTECVLKSKEIQERIRQTMLERYNVVNPLQSKEIRDRKDATCLERYGTSVIMHVPELFERCKDNAFRRKQMTLPSGKVIVYQGYEDIAIRDLLETYQEGEFVMTAKEVPRIPYVLDGKEHMYFPDIYVPKERKIIEVKSTHTYTFTHEQNKAKREGVIQAGYGFEFWICDKKKVLYKTQGWDTLEEVPWYRKKAVGDGDDEKGVNDESVKQ